MERIKYRISLDMFEVASQTTIKAKKGDTACSIYITLTENGKVYKIDEGCTAFFSAKKPDGNYLFNSETCRIEDNTIIYDFTEQTTPIEGIVECEVVLKKGEDKLTSPRFNLKVDATVYNGEDIISTPEADALKELTDRAEQIVNQYDEGIIVGKKYVDNNFANALKGNPSGKVVAIKDISPLQHDIKVKCDDTITLLDGWLPFQVSDNYPYTPSLLSGSNYYEFEGGASKFTLKTKTKRVSYWGLTFRTDQGSYVGGFADGFGVNEYCYWYVQYSNNEFLFAFYRDAEMTDLILETSRTCTSNTKILTAESYGDENVEVVITQEVDATVKVCGKNLFDVSKVISGYWITNNGDGSITVKTPSSSSSSSAATPNTLRDYAPTLKVGETYVFSAVSDGTTQTIYLPGAKVSWWFNKTLTITDEILDSAVYWYAKGVSTTATISNIQIEKGTTATEYEPYKEPVTYTADANGEINIPSQYPSMTLVSDAEMNVEYNRDINKAFAELTSAIISMGGNL